MHIKHTTITSNIYYFYFSSIYYILLIRQGFRLENNRLYTTKNTISTTNVRYI
jgi:hypothetical protein